MAMNLEQMRECKHALGYSNETIAELSGVPVATVRKIFGGVTRNPRQKTMEALTKVLQKGMSRPNPTEVSLRRKRMRILLQSARTTEQKPKRGLP